MSRADLLKRLFRSYQSRNDEAFVEAAQEIIDDERKKHHILLANELSKILDNGHLYKMLDSKNGFEVLPKDSDRGVPLIEIKYPDRFLFDIVLFNEQAETLDSVLNQFRMWEVLEANALRPSHRLLFCGPPGCGKTVTAEAIAGELGLPLLYVRFDAVVSSLLGETASNLRKVFDYASKGTWVLFFDEFDAIGRSRDDSSEHGELKRVVNTFLQMLDRFEGRSLVIAATNFEQSLDPALWRRFDEVVRFDKPGTMQIRHLIRSKLGHRNLTKHFESFATKRFCGMTHADIERACWDILKRAILESKESIEQGDLEWAISRQEMRKQAVSRSQATNEAQVDRE